MTNRIKLPGWFMMAPHAIALASSLSKVSAQKLNRMIEEEIEEFRAHIREKTLGDGTLPTGTKESGNDID